MGGDKMKKLFLLAALAATAAVAVMAADAKLDELVKQRADLKLKIQETRVSLIEKDPKLKERHEAIMKMCRELEAEMMRRDEMKKLADDLDKVEQEIKKLQRLNPERNIRQ